MLTEAAMRKFVLAHQGKIATAIAVAFLVVPGAMILVGAYVPALSAPLLQIFPYYSMAVMSVMFVFAFIMRRTPDRLRPGVTVHISDVLHGESTEEWDIEQIGRDIVERMSVDGEMFVSVHYEHGVPKQFFVPKNDWLKMVEMKRDLERRHRGV